MTTNEFKARFEAELKRRFLIELNDTNISEAMFAQWAGEETTPEDCAREWGWEYELTDMVSDPWMR